MEWRRANRVVLPAGWRGQIGGPGVETPPSSNPGSPQLKRERRAWPVTLSPGRVEERMQEVSIQDTEPVKVVAEARGSTGGVLPMPVAAPKLLPVPRSPG